MGGAARGRRRRAPDAARLPARAFGFLSRQARRGGRRRGGLGRRPGSRSPRSTQLRATARRSTVGAHLSCRADVVRIYSTSGTTGAPSYIPLTAGDLANWVTGSARSYAASESPRATALSRPTTPGRSSPAPRSTRSRSRGQSHPGRHRLERTAAARRSTSSGPSASSSRLPTRRTCSSWPTCAGRACERVLVAGEPGGGEPAFRAKLSGAGERGSPRRWASATSAPSLWGECEEQDGMHLGARGFVHAELIDPETGARAASSPTARGRARAHAPAPSGGAAPSLPHPRPRRGVDEPCPCGRTAPRVRCIGRTDDMLIVRGVNVFPSAVREVVDRRSRRASSGSCWCGRAAAGVKQEPPLPVAVELAARRRRRRRARGRDPRSGCATCWSCRPGSSSCRGAACSAASTSPDSSPLIAPCASSRPRASTTSRSSAPTARPRSTSGRACSACRSSSSSRTSTTPRRATSTSTPATAG